MPVSSFDRKARENAYKRTASTTVSSNRFQADCDTEESSVWQHKSSESPFNSTRHFLSLPWLQRAEICSRSGSHTALGTAQLYHHRLLSPCMYQGTLQTHKACHKEVVLHQSVLMNSAVLSNKWIQSVSHSAKGLIAAGSAHLLGKHQLQSCSRAWVCSCSTSTSSRNFAACSYKHSAWLSFLCKAPISLIHSLHPFVLQLNRIYHRNEPGIAVILIQWMNILHFQPKNVCTKVLFGLFSISTVCSPLPGCKGRWRTHADVRWQDLLLSYRLQLFHKHQKNPQTTTGTFQCQKRKE